MFEVKQIFFVCYTFILSSSLQNRIKNKGVNTKSTKHIYNNYLNNNYLLKKRKNTKSTIACI